MSGFRPGDLWFDRYGHPWRAVDDPDLGVVLVDRTGQLTLLPSDVMDLYGPVWLTQEPVKTGAAK